MSFLKRQVPPSVLEAKLTKWQKFASILLYIFLLCHGTEVLMLNWGKMEWAVPGLQLIAVVVALMFFLVECIILPPKGFLIMTAVAALLSWIAPYCVRFLVQTFFEAIIFMVIGGFIAALSVGYVITVVNGVVVSAVIAPTIVGPAAVAVGVTAAAGAGIAGAAAGVNAGLSKIRAAKLIRLGGVLVNFLLFVVLVWPVFTWTGVFQGVFALKPVQRAQQEYISFSKENLSKNYEAFFKADPDRGYLINGTLNWTFDEGFYDSYIYPGRNTFAQGATPAASNDSCIAFCLNGLVYQVDTIANETYHTTAYSVSQEDAMVLVDKAVFIFGYNRIGLLDYGQRYRWKDTTWTSDFESLSREMQYERLYTVLEVQNDGQPGAIPVEDVAVVAYAQRNGLLLFYDTASHCAYFGQEGKRGEITILRQSAPGIREEAAVFTPNCDSENLPYTMIDAETLFYIDGDKIMYQGVGAEWSGVYLTTLSHNGEQHPFVAIHMLHDPEGNQYFAFQDSTDMIYLDRPDSSVIEVPFDAGKYDAVYSVGNYIYAVVYDSGDFLNQYTYLRDLREGETITSVWTEKWNWERIHVHGEIWDGKKVEETVPPEERPLSERFPVPVPRTSVKQIGLYKDNVISPSGYSRYEGPVENFAFSVPPILYEDVEYTYSEDETEIRIHYYCQDDPSSLTVTLRPNTDGIDHQTLLTALQDSAEEEMTNVKVVHSGYADPEGTASMFYLTGNVADGTGMICTRLCRVDGEYIMEMELRMPKATSQEDQAHKDYLARALYDCCGFGSGEEPPAWSKFKKKYGL